MIIFQDVNMMNMKGHLYKAKPTASALMEQDIYFVWVSIIFKRPCEPFKYASTSKISIQNGLHKPRVTKGRRTIGNYWIPGPIRELTLDSRLYLGINIRFIIKLLNILVVHHSHKWIIIPWQDGPIPAENSQTTDRNPLDRSLMLQLNGTCHIQRETVLSRMLTMKLNDIWNTKNFNGWTWTWWKRTPI